MDLLRFFKRVSVFTYDSEDSYVGFLPYAKEK